MGFPKQGYGSGLPFPSPHCSVLTSYFSMEHEFYYICLCLIWSSLSLFWWSTQNTPNTCQKNGSAPVINTSDEGPILGNWLPGWKRPCWELCSPYISFMDMSFKRISKKLTHKAIQKKAAFLICTVGYVSGPLCLCFQVMQLFLPWSSENVRDLLLGFYLAIWPSSWGIREQSLWPGLGQSDSGLEVDSMKYLHVDGFFGSVPVLVKENRAWPAVWWEGSESHQGPVWEAPRARLWEVRESAWRRGPGAQCEQGCPVLSVCPEQIASLCAEEAAAQEQTGQVEECLKVNLLKIKTEGCKKVTTVNLRFLLLVFLSSSSSSSESYRLCISVLKSKPAFQEFYPCLLPNSLGFWPLIACNLNILTRLLISCEYVSSPWLNQCLSAMLK